MRYLKYTSNDGLLYDKAKIYASVGGCANSNYTVENSFAVYNYLIIMFGHKFRFVARCCYLEYFIIANTIEKIKYMCL